MVFDPWMRMRLVVNRKVGVYASGSVRSSHIPGSLASDLGQFRWLDSDLSCSALLALFVSAASCHPALGRQRIKADWALIGLALLVDPELEAQTQCTLWSAWELAGLALPNFHLACPRSRPHLARGGPHLTSASLASGPEVRGTSIDILSNHQIEKRILGITNLWQQQIFDNVAEDPLMGCPVNRPSKAQMLALAHIKRAPNEFGHGVEDPTSLTAS